MDTIEVQDVGPVKRVTIPLPKGGGVTVLRGMNDTGKSLTLDATSRLLGGKQKVTRREGVATPGSIEGLGITLTVGASARRSGELLATSIEGQLSIDDLIGPPLKDPAVADKTRIRAILRLTNAEADPALFYDLLGGQEHFEEVVPLAARATEDLVDMAVEVKRAIEETCRKAGAQAEHYRSQAAALKKGAEEIDVSRPCDAAELQAAVELAVGVSQRHVDYRRAYDRALERASAAGRSIEQAEAAYDGQGPTAATEAVEKALNASDAGCERAADAKQVYEAAREEAERLNTRYIIAGEEQKTAREHERALAAWQEQVDAVSQCDNPPDELLESTQQAITTAREAIETGALVRGAKEALERVAGIETQAKEKQVVAERLREAAQSVDSVLAEAIDVPGLRVKDGRLVTEKSDGSEVYFADRSFGARCKLSLDAIMAKLPTNGDLPVLIPLSQRQWEGLDYANREALSEAAKARGLNIITAEADRVPPADGDGDGVRAEVFPGAE
jgi:hypothetical protein